MGVLAWPRITWILSFPSFRQRGCSLSQSYAAWMRHLHPFARILFSLASQSSQSGKKSLLNFSPSLHTLKSYSRIWLIQTVIWIWIWEVISLLGILKGNLHYQKKKVSEMLVRLLARSFCIYVCLWCFIYYIYIYILIQKRLAINWDSVILNIPRSWPVCS